MVFEITDISELAKWAGGIIAALSVVVEISPIKLNPWSALARWIGKAINGDVIDKVEALNKDVLELRQSTDERHAKLLRSRILTFGDEILHEVEHSKESFDNILLDITEYEKYCKDHPEFLNNMTKLTTKRIQDVYAECLKHGNFK